MDGEDIFCDFSISYLNKPTGRIGRFSDFIAEWSKFENILYYKINNDWRQIIAIQSSPRAFSLFFDTCKVKIPIEDEVCWAIMHIETSFNFISQNGGLVMSVPLFNNKSSIEKTEVTQKDYWKTIIFLEEIIYKQKENFSHNMSKITSLNLELQQSLTEANNKSTLIKSLFNKTMKNG